MGIPAVTGHRQGGVRRMRNVSRAYVRLSLDSWWGRVTKCTFGSVWESVDEILEGAREGCEWEVEVSDLAIILPLETVMGAACLSFMRQTDRSRCCGPRSDATAHCIRTH